MSSARLLVALSVLVLGLAAARVEADFPKVGPGGKVCVDAGPDQFAPCKPVKPHSLWAWLTYQPLEKPGLCGCCKRGVQCCTPPLYVFFLCNGCGGSACASCQGCAGK